MLIFIPLNLHFFCSQDCSTAPYTSDVESFPSAKMNYEELMDYFLTEFGLNPLEVTALMGAHTLGQANIFNSGYNGPWVSGETSVFNNKYYSNMVRDNGVTWRLTQRDCANINGVNTNRCADDQTTGWQYVSGGVGFNLPADVALSQVNLDAKVYFWLRQELKNCKCPFVTSFGPN